MESTTDIFETKMNIRQVNFTFDNTVNAIHDIIITTNPISIYCVKLIIKSITHMLKQKKKCKSI